MATWTSEDLNKREVVAKGNVRLNGWVLTNTGTEDRFVAFKDGDQTRPLVVVPKEDSVSMSGLNEPFPEGLAVESLVGDGVLIANVFYVRRGLRRPEPDEEEEEAPDEEEEPSEEPDALLIVAEEEE